MLNIRSSLKRKILNYFFLNEKEEVYINELARIIGSDAKNVYRILIGLESDGILASRFSGKERFFFANTGNLLYKSYKEIFLKTAGIDNVVKDGLRNITGIEEAYIFGSYANGDFSQKSDIGILIIGSHDPIEADRVIYDIAKASGREFNTLHMTRDELLAKRSSGDQFISSVFKDKTIRLI